MGRCKSMGTCCVCNCDILVYDDYVEMWNSTIKRYDLICDFTDETKVGMLNPCVKKYYDSRWGVVLDEMLKSKIAYLKKYTN